MANTIVSERPPHAQELVNCIDRCPMEGRHHVAIHIQNIFQVELPPGEHAWTDKDNVSEYKVSNVVFTDIRYKVIEPLEPHQTFWTWLHAFVFGPPDVQTVIMSFEVKQVTETRTDSPGTKVSDAELIRV
jgi:hypothetical protein